MQGSGSGLSPSTGMFVCLFPFNYELRWSEVTTLALWRIAILSNNNAVFEYCGIHLMLIRLADAYSSELATIVESYSNYKDNC